MAQVIVITVDFLQRQFQVQFSPSSSYELSNQNYSKEGEKKNLQKYTNVQWLLFIQSDICFYMSIYTKMLILLIVIIILIVLMVAWRYYSTFPNEYK